MNLSALEKKENFFNGLKDLFASLNVPVNYIDEKSIAPKEILSKTFKDTNEAYQLMDDVFVLGMVDNAAFEGKKSETIAGISKGKKDYEGILIFGVTLKNRDKGLLPTRSQLAEITRAFNREFYYTPVVVVFRYMQFISIANAERITYKQEWREGEKAGKVSLLRDINVAKPHTGHFKILQELTISRTGKGAVNTFAELYTYWQSVFNVSILNKKFYKDLSDWYFWALHEVAFPATTYTSDKNSLFKEEERVKEHTAKNLIRLLTRLLFVWFVKEKNLIPEELFDETYIKENLINGFEPRKKKNFDHKSQSSKYYRAILQNLFFATLNQTVGKREFRKEGQQMNVTNLMRYESYFKNPMAFIKLVENIVPFMNGGLFECLDSPDPLMKGKRGGDVIIYEDGFSDRKDNTLSVPDYIFFGTDEHADLSEELGDKKHKDVTVNGLINILNSYKFTVTENTPIEEDVALDPELLGRVFENLLASYNPETKTTARKQTGSFYTPREIVNYMVDESLKAYLKQKLETEAGMKPEDVEKKLESLIGYNETYFHNGNCFDDKQTTVIIKAIDNCKILDPACGSGAFPMGILHKLVHILHKLDADNKLWKEVQRQKAIKETEDAFKIGNKLERENRLKEISDVFEYNSDDYGRKLFLIENCIYGVDIQPIATQISKLRFFISLIVDQKADKSRDNFGIRPLPNLETKFVAANTLIGIEKPKTGDYIGSLFDNKMVKELEEKLREVRHRLFSAKSPATKRKLWDEDQKLRETMGLLLTDAGWGNETAKQLAGWDPYNQNASSPFFDPEWMFGVSEGFDVVIGNPPYVSHDKLIKKEVFKKQYKTYEAFADIYCYFIESGLKSLTKQGILSFITSNSYIKADYGRHLRAFISEKANVNQLINIEESQLFESAIVNTAILILRKTNKRYPALVVNSKIINNDDNFTEFVSNTAFIMEQNRFKTKFWLLYNNNILTLKDAIEKDKRTLEDMNCKIRLGIATGDNNAFVIGEEKRRELIQEDKNNNMLIKPVLRGRDINRWNFEKPDHFIILTKNGVNVKDNFPVLYTYFDKIGDGFKKRGAQGKHWTNLRACAFFEDFKLSKIVWIELADKGRFAICDEEYYCLNSAYFLIPPVDVNKYVLLAILNSSIIRFYLCLIAETSGMGTNRWINNYVKEFPIPDIISYEEPISQVAKLLCSLIDRTNSKLMAFFESIIDAMVYELYFPDEIKAANAEVLKHLTNLPELKDDWSDEKKMNTIEKLYHELSNTKHPVAIAIERQKMVKEVRIIEGLDTG